MQTHTTHNSHDYSSKRVVTASVCHHSHVKTYSYPHSPGEVADALMMLVENKDSNGAILQVSKTRGAVYRKRMIVDADGASNPFFCD